MPRLLLEKLMPWKEPGKGDKDPWKSGDQQPPDLEEIFGNLSKRLQSLFGGGKGSGSETRGGGTPGMGGAFSLLLLLIIFWVLHSVLIQIKLIVLTNAGKIYNKRFSCHKWRITYSIKYKKMLQ